MNMLGVTQPYGIVQSHMEVLKASRTSKMMAKNYKLPHDTKHQESPIMLEIYTKKFKDAFAEANQKVSDPLNFGYA